MPYFTMNRRISINSTLGACLNFLKDKPEFVPEFMRKEVEEKGGVEVEEPEVDAPYSVDVLSASNAAPVVCIVDGAAMSTIKTGDLASLNSSVPQSGTITAVTPESFTIDGTDLSAESAPLTGLTATITPEVPGTKSGGKYEVCKDEPPEDEATREEAMHVAFEQMVIKGTASDDHVPSVRDVSEAVGFRVTAAERDAAWESFKRGD